MDLQQQIIYTAFPRWFTASKGYCEAQWFKTTTEISLSQEDSDVIVAKLVSFVLTVSMQHGLRMAHISVMKKTTVWADMVFDPMEKWTQNTNFEEEWA